jgi:hypothetical protein
LEVWKVQKGQKDLRARKANLERQVHWVRRVRMAWLAPMVPRENWGQ